MFSEVWFCNQCFEFFNWIVALFNDFVRGHRLNKTLANHFAPLNELLDSITMIKVQCSELFVLSRRRQVSIIKWCNNNNNGSDEVVGFERVWLGPCGKWRVHSAEPAPVCTVQGCMCARRHSATWLRHAVVREGSVGVAETFLRCLFPGTCVGAL